MLAILFHLISQQNDITINAFGQDALRIRVFCDLNFQAKWIESGDSQTLFEKKKKNFPQGTGPQKIQQADKKNPQRNTSMISLTVFSGKKDLVSFTSYFK